MTHGSAYHDTKMENQHSKAKLLYRRVSRNAILCSILALFFVALLGVSLIFLILNLDRLIQNSFHQKHLNDEFSQVKNNNQIISSTYTNNAEFQKFVLENKSTTISTDPKNFESTLKFLESTEIPTELSTNLTTEFTTELTTELTTEFTTEFTREYSQTEPIIFIPECLESEISTKSIEKSKPEFSFSDHSFVRRRELTKSNPESTTTETATTQIQSFQFSTQFPVNLFNSIETNILLPTEKPSVPKILLDDLLQTYWQKLESVWHNSLGCKYAIVMSCETPLKDKILHQVKLDESIKEQFKQLMSQKDKNQYKDKIENLIQQTQEHIRYHESTEVDLCQLNWECQRCVQDHVDYWSQIGHGCGSEEEWRVIRTRPRMGKVRSKRI